MSKRTKALALLSGWYLLIALILALEGSKAPVSELEWGLLYLGGIAEITIGAEVLTRLRRALH